VKNELYDVAIIGGGPAGSTAATLLARAGRRVVVFEREKFPRFHIGESLLPASMKVFTRLGVSEKFRRAGFIEKFGGDMAGSDSKKGVKFYFEDGYGSKCDRSYQVTRAHFDEILLDHAAENGAEVHEETIVESAAFADAGVHLRVLHKNEPARELSARYLIDASGRNSFIGVKFNLKKNYEELHKFSIFAHYIGVDREEGRDGTLTRMIRGLDRWFWMIPLTSERSSIGIVVDIAVFRTARQSPERFFEEALAEQPLILQSMRGAERVTPVYTATDFSYRNTKLVGDRWLLAGDAAGFIDPVFSSGVFLAVMSGELAADVLCEAFDHPKRVARLFVRYERRVNKAMDVYLRFVHSWYQKEFIEVFVHPQEILQIPQAVNAILGGNIGGSFAINWRMRIFYLIVWLQRYAPLCPRLTLLPKRETPAVPSPSLKLFPDK
jgi:geranylgeranyl reductase family protein